MEPPPALPADGEGTAAHDASADPAALLGVKAPVKEGDEPSAEEDTSGKQEESAVEEPALSQEPEPAARKKEEEAFAVEKAELSVDQAAAKKEEKTVAVEMNPALSEDQSAAKKEEVAFAGEKAELSVNQAARKKEEETIVVEMKPALSEFPTAGKNKKAFAVKMQALSEDMEAGKKKKAFAVDKEALSEDPSAGKKKEALAVEKPAAGKKEEEAFPVKKLALSKYLVAGKEEAAFAVKKPRSEVPAACKQDEKDVLAEEKPVPCDDPAGKQSVSAVGTPVLSEHPTAGRYKDKETSAEKKPAPSDLAKGKACAEEKPSSENPVGDDRKAADEGDKATADLPVDIVLAIAARLPSLDAGRSVVLSKTYRDRVGDPVFLKSHLAPAGSRSGDMVPSTVVLQPAGERVRRLGYTHLTILDPPRGNNFIYNMPVRCAYEYDDDEEDDGGYYDYALTYVDVGPEQVKTPSPFFHKTVPALDLHLLASEGCLLLAHSPKHGMFVCNPSHDRFVRLPHPPVDIDDGCRTTAGIRYKVGPWGEIEKLDAVLLSPMPSGHVALQKFSSDGGGWMLTDIGEESVLSILARVSAPGIYAGEADAFYWVDEDTGSLIEYVVDHHLLSVVSPPPKKTDGDASSVVGWALGSTSGMPRLSSFAVPASDHAFAEIHGINGVLCVWIKKEIGWVMVKELSLPVAWAFHLHRGLELPVDVSRAHAECLMVRKDQELLWRDLTRDEVEFISNLYLRVDSELNRMYYPFKAFSV